MSSCKAGSPISTGCRACALTRLNPEAPRPKHDIIPNGRRNDTLFHFALEQAPNVDDLDALLDVVRTRNMDCERHCRTPRSSRSQARLGATSKRTGTSSGVVGRW